ncbi:MAG TPA: TIM barrel protein [Phycisphaerae bacterium]|nr:TIM barrel protein [Phycisphaerae bacterium]
MIRSGLVSITFRKLSAEEIVALVREAGLEGIEWGGDVHVPHGDLDRAREVRRMTEDAALTVAAYGSYYRVGHEEPVPFEEVLTTAVALGAPLIRVWAGEQGSDQADAAYRELVVRDSRRIADAAAREGIAVAYECHANSLTDTTASACALLESVAHDNVRTYWQPTVGASVETCLEGIDALRDRLANVHVFHWEAWDRRPLAEGQDPWRGYLEKIASTGREHFAMLEFVADDCPAAFRRDAATLRQWLQDL